MAVFLLMGCGRDVHNHPELTTGKQLFEHHCAECHQESGEGAFLRGIPPVIYTAMTYRQLVGYIQGHGRPDGTRMPTYESMPREEAEKIAIYVRRRLKAG
jgi:mono/diheme cytochrome c family protein